MGKGNIERDVLSHPRYQPPVMKVHNCITRTSDSKEHTIQLHTIAKDKHRVLVIVTRRS